MKVDIVDYQLGFTQGKLNFFVAPWINLKDLVTYRHELTQEQKIALDSTLSILFEEFNDYEDFGGPNMGYNPETNSLVIFDLQKK